MNRRIWWRTWVLMLTLLTVMSFVSAASAEGLQEKIVYSKEVGDMGGSETFIANPDGTDEQQLTQTPSLDETRNQAVEPALSPDGTKIAYASDWNGGSYEIWVMNVDGSNKVQITHNNMRNVEPVWSPDGSKILFSSDCISTDFENCSVGGDGSSDIWVYDINTGTFSNLTNTPNVYEESADWSPDGTKIVYSAYWKPSQFASNQWDLFVANADGTNPQPLTNDKKHEYHPKWSVNDTIFFIRDDTVTIPDYQFGIYQLNPTTKTVSPLYSQNGWITWMAVNPDGNQIDFTVSGDGTYTMDLANPTPVKILPVGSAISDWGYAQQ